jgi:hypothetical protein
LEQRKERARSRGFYEALTDDTYVDVAARLLSLGADYKSILDADETDYLIEMKILHKAEQIYFERRQVEIEAIIGAVVMGR